MICWRSIGLRWGILVIIGGWIWVGWLMGRLDMDRRSISCCDGTRWNGGSILLREEGIGLEMEKALTQLVMHELGLLGV